MRNFRDRKKQRTEHYFKHVYKWKLQQCSACSGSGFYDDNDSPPCAACNGTGKERIKTILEVSAMDIEHEYIFLFKLRGYGASMLEALDNCMNAVEDDELGDPEEGCLVSTTVGGCEIEWSSNSGSSFLEGRVSDVSVAKILIQDEKFRNHTDWKSFNVICRDFCGGSVPLDPDLLEGLYDREEDGIYKGFSLEGIAELHQRIKKRCARPK